MNVEPLATDEGSEGGVRAAAGLRVAFVCRTDMIIPGGHQVQRESLAAALRRVGAEVRMVNPDQLEPAEFDVIHIFDADMGVIRLAHRHRRPVVLTPVYFSQSVGRNFWQTFSGRARTAGSFGLATLRGRQTVAVRRLLDGAIDRSLLYEAADLLLPNSEGEKAAIQRELGITTPMTVVPNGVEPEVFNVELRDPDSRKGVLCVSRLEPHKNQLALLRALRDTDLPVTLVGWPHPHHPEYVTRCRVAAARQGAELLDGVDRQELASTYGQFRVHVLPSWFETTGLVSLEAALTGCNIVSTSRGHAREYLGDYAWYCDPASRASIRDAVATAYDSPLTGAAGRHIAAEFSMSRVADLTLATYRSVL